MAKPKAGEVNKSQEVRMLLKENPNITVGEAVETLSSRGITIAKALFYFVKGKSEGKKAREAKASPGFAINGAPTNGNGNGHAALGVSILKHESVGNVGNVLATMKTLKDMAGAVGGVNRLKEMLEVMA